MSNFESLSQSVISGKEAQVKEQVKAMVDAGADPLEIINQGLIAGMNVVGARFKNGEMFVPEVLMSAKSLSAGIEIVKPLIADTDMPSKGKIILGDEISPDNCRFWDSETHEKLDKDRFRRDMGNVEDAYKEILHRLTGEVR